LRAHRWSHYLVTQHVQGPNTAPPHAGKCMLVNLQCVF
jgi:hypothetical protein